MSNIRITDKDLKVKEKAVNELLDKVQVKIGHRYSYTAIDLVSKENNTMITTLIAGLSRKEAFEFLEAIQTLLRYEKVRK